MKSGRKSPAIAALAGTFLAVLAFSPPSEARGKHLRPVVLSEPSTVVTHAARREHFTTWLRGHLPSGGSVGHVDGELVVTHAVKSRTESWQSIALAYLPVTTIYDKDDFARAIAKANLAAAKGGLVPGVELTIPAIVTAPYAAGERERIGLPRDGVVKGIYVRGETAARRTYPAMLDRMVSRGLNAIVLDVKDYDGELTYPSKVATAVEAGATKHAQLVDFARTVRFAHARGIRVVARVSCFSDELMAKKRPSMAVRGQWGGPYGNGWLDPNSETAQSYILDLVKEAIDHGVDEIELDYVRYPVTHVKTADFGLDLRKNHRAKVDVITRFVERVHAVTRRHDVPLSLDVFGVIAFGKKIDIENLGQDPGELGRHAEFLSPMVYPSHYDPGFMGWESPGDHPEIVGMGVKSILETMEQAGVRSSGAKIRPWLQGMWHKSPTFGPWYIQKEIQTSNDAAGTGWLLWNSSQDYSTTWQALRERHHGGGGGRAVVPVRARFAKRK